MRVSFHVPKTTLVVILYFSGLTLQSYSSSLRDADARLSPHSDAKWEVTPEFHGRRHLRGAQSTASASNDVIQKRPWWLIGNQPSAGAQSQTHASNGLMAEADSNEDKKQPSDGQVDDSSEDSLFGLILAFAVLGGIILLFCLLCATLWFRKIEAHKIKGGSEGPRDVETGTQEVKLPQPKKIPTRFGSSGSTERNIHDLITTTVSSKDSSATKA